MIEARNLFRIESKLKTIPVKTIEKDYVLSWILIGIAKSSMLDILNFKGGTALRKFYFPDYRFSQDLDFTLLRDISIEDIEKMLQEVYFLVLEACNIRLTSNSKKREIHSNGYTLFVNFSGPLGADISKGEVKTDFTRNEKLINRPIVRKLFREYDEYYDIPEDIELKIYPLEEIFIEKYVSILDPQRNEPRDMYDLWYLASNRCLGFEHLGAQIMEKGLHKGITSFDILEVLLRKEHNYKKLWTERLANQMVELPYFETVYRELKRYLRSLDFPSK